MSRTEPRWLSRLVVDAIQADMLVTHGGIPGLRDENALESALARPRQRFAYEPRTDLAGLAAAYGYGLIRDHPYNDGNKRVGFVAMATFLGLNGYGMVTDEGDVVTTIVAVASGGLDEEALAAWVRRSVRLRPKGSTGY